MADTGSVTASATTGRSGQTGTSNAKGKGRSKANLTEHARNARLGREMIGHCVFLAVYCVVTVLPVDDPNVENFTYSMRSMFMMEDNLLFNSNSSFAGPRFVDVLSVSDYWKWLKGPFLHTAYMTDWYRGDPWTVGDQGVIAGNNVIVGTINVRQKRVRRATCVIPQIFKGAQELTDCIADYHPGVEDKEAYGPFYTEPEWANAFSYTKTWPQFWGEIRHYNKGAYGIELPAASCKTNAGADVACITRASGMLYDLEMTGWIDHRTRAVMTELTVYNPSLNRFALVQAVLELPSSGATAPYMNVRTAKLIRYATTGDFAILGLEIALCLLVLLDVMEKVVFYRQYKLRLWQQPWDMFDICLHLLYIIYFVFRMVALLKFNELNYDPTVRIYYNFADAVYWHDVGEALAAVLAWFLWMRLMKFLNELSWARLILQSLRRASGPLVGLFSVGFFLLLAFAHTGLLAFGTQMHDLRTFGTALASTFRFLFAGMRYEEFRAAGEVMGPIYYIVFKVWMVLILVRFAVAVLLDAYREVMDENRHRWPLSFPPLEALAKDVAVWWQEHARRRAGKAPMRPFGGSIADSGVAHTLSGVSASVHEQVGLRPLSWLQDVWARRFSGPLALPCNARLVSGAHSRDRSDVGLWCAQDLKGAETQIAQLDAREMYDVLQHRVCAQWRAAYAAPAVTTPLLFRIPVRACRLHAHVRAQNNQHTRPTLERAGGRAAAPHGPADIEYREDLCDHCGAPGRDAGYSGAPADGKCGAHGCSQCQQAVDKHAHDSVGCPPQFRERVALVTGARLPELGRVGGSRWGWVLQIKIPVPRPQRRASSLRQGGFTGETLGPVLPLISTLFGAFCVDKGVGEGRRSERAGVAFDGCQHHRFGLL